MELRLTANKKSRELLQKNIDYYGKWNQLSKAVSELNELIDAISIDLDTWEEEDTKNTIDEIADVIVMCQQLIMIFGIEDDVKERIKFKLERQRQRIKNKNRSD